MEDALINGINPFTSLAESTANQHIVKLQHQIRYATSPDSPELIGVWLRMTQDASKTLSAKNRRAQHRAEFRLLLDTYCDELLPTHWRDTCLNAINRPLVALNGLSQSADHQKEIKALLNELRVTSHFYYPV